MKTWSDQARIAIEAGTAISHGALYVGCAPTPLAIWSGHGQIVLGDAVTYSGLGDASLMTPVGQALGGTEQATVINIDGIDPTDAAMLDASGLRDAPVRVWRLIFDQTGTFLDAQLYAQGSLDQLSRSLAEDQTFTFSLSIEGAARGLGRSGGRLASGVDQRLIDGADGSLDEAAGAGQVTLYWGGQPPAQAANVVNPSDVASRLIGAVAGGAFAP